jgi:hypothetical protein
MSSGNITARAPYFVIYHGVLSEPHFFTHRSRDHGSTPFTFSGTFSIFTRTNLAVQFKERIADFIPQVLVPRLNNPFKNSLADARFTSHDFAASQLTNFLLSYMCI